MQDGTLHPSSRQSDFGDMVFLALEENHKDRWSNPSQKIAEIQNVTSEASCASCWCSKISDFWTFWIADFFFFWIRIVQPVRYAGVSKWLWNLKHNLSISDSSDSACYCRWRPCHPHGIATVLSAVSDRADSVCGMPLSESETAAIVKWILHKSI